MRKNLLGTDTLNNLIPRSLNPEGPAVRRGSALFRQGDRVMQLRNNYDKDVFNGDVGFIVSADPEERRLVVVFDGRPVEYSAGDMDELSLAYATTIHKSQGSEYPAVICAFLRSQSFMLQRNLIYTALTRARRIAIFISDPYTLRAAIENNRPSERFTRLSNRIAEQLDVKSDVKIDAK